MLSFKPIQQTWGSETFLFLSSSFSLFLSMCISLSLSVSLSPFVSYSISPCLFHFFWFLFHSFPPSLYLHISGFLAAAIDTDSIMCSWLYLIFILQNFLSGLAEKENGNGESSRRGLNFSKKLKERKYFISNPSSSFLPSFLLSSWALSLLFSPLPLIHNICLLSLS